MMKSMLLTTFDNHPIILQRQFMRNLLIVSIIGNKSPAPESHVASEDWITIQTQDGFTDFLGRPVD